MDGRTGHAIETGRFRCLHQGEATAGPHRKQTPGTIGAGAGEHHRHAVLAPVLGNRLKQQIDAGAGGEAGLGIQKPQPIPLHPKVPIGRAHHDHARCQAIAVNRRHHRKVGGMGQEIHHQAGVVGGEVLGHHVAHRAGGRQLAHQVLQRFKPPRGGADAHHMPEPRRTGRLGRFRSGGIGIVAKGRSCFRRLLHRAVPPGMFGERLLPENNGGPTE